MGDADPLLICELTSEVPAEGDRLLVQVSLAQDFAMVTAPSSYLKLFWTISNQHHGAFSKSHQFHLGFQVDSQRQNIHNYRFMCIVNFSSLHFPFLSVTAALAGH